MARVFKTGITAEGDIVASQNLKSNYSSGDEGGEIFLNKPVTGTSINTGVTIDVYQNKLRFWENGGTNRGAYITLTDAATGVGTNLLGSATDTNYYPSAIVFNAGTTAGPTLDLTMSGAGAPDLTAVAIPSASATASGIVTTDTQTFAGTKTFSSTITGSISGNAGTATTLATARNINGVSFNGSADITVTAAAGTLTGTTLNSGVTASSLTSVGTIATGTWDATAIADGKIASALTGKTYNGLTVTSTTGTLTISSGKTLTVSRSLILTGSTDGVTMTFPSTNATIARTDAAQTFTGTQTFSSSIDTPGIARTGANSLALSTANQSGSAGSVTITGGNSTSAGSGGSITLTAGNYASSGTPGNVTINAGGGAGNGNINIGTAIGSNQPITLGTTSSTVDVPGVLTNVKVANGGVFSFSGYSTTSGLTTLTNVPGTVGFATATPSVLISVLTSAATTNTGSVGAEFRATSSTTTHLITFSSGTTARGSISTNSTTTTYSTSSDYRLKENVQPITGALDRLMLLKPSRFNFIEFPDRIVDGFIAHEAQEVVPESVVGNKDDTNEDGSPAYQGIDQSKLVPLLTAALQEAILRIEALEARLDA